MYAVDPKATNNMTKDYSYIIIKIFNYFQRRRKKK